MKLHLQMLHRGEDLRQCLKHDGWQLEPENDGSVSATHPLVATESDARHRLNHLGLLTSRLLRIGFPFPPSTVTRRPRPGASVALN